MKLLFSILVLGTFCTDTANSYIASSPAGAEWNNAKSFAQPPANVEVDGIFREEYHEWAKLYGKSTSDRIRFENFKLNFMLQMQHNKKTGTFNLLNEFGDSKYKNSIVVMHCSFAYDILDFKSANPRSHK